MHGRQWLQSHQQGAGQPMRFGRLHRRAPLLGGLLLVAPPSLADPQDQIKRAEDAILALCLATGSEQVEVRDQGGSIVVGNEHNSVQINRKDYVGIVGGISKDITALGAQQATEARTCTQRYLNEVVHFILHEDRSEVVDSVNPDREKSRGSEPSSDSEAIYIHSRSTDDIAYQISESLARRLEQLGLSVASEKKDAGINIEIETIRSTGPDPNISDRVSWATSVSIDIAIRGLKGAKLILTKPFHASAEADEPKKSEYSAILLTTNAIADYINLNRGALLPIR